MIVNLRFKLYYLWTCVVQRRDWLYSEEAGSRVEWRGQLNRFNWISSQSRASSRPSPSPHRGGDNRVWSNLRQWAIFSVSTLCLYTAAEPRPRCLNDWCCLCPNGQQYQCSDGQSTYLQSMQHIIFCILPPLHSLFTQTGRIAPGINDGPKHEYADTKADM